MDNKDLLLQDKFDALINSIVDKKEIRRLTNFRNFLIKAQKVHGDKYDYSKVVYINARSKIEIICPEHGSFYQEASTHIRKIKPAGCPYCSGNAKLTTEEFIKRSKEIYGDKFDYSETIYINERTPIKIICPKHGPFYQRMDHHLSGKYGCPNCKQELEREESFNKFIEISNNIHNNKYDYSKIKFINLQIKVEIICPEHGSFWQSPKAHMSGAECPKCNNKNKTTEEFIQQAKEIHGNKYDYSLTLYNHSKKKVKIICPIHGIFEQTPNEHLKGHGCPKCAGFHRTTKIFIQQAINIHGNTYDYSKTIYTKAKNPVIIICKEHGEFLQTPKKHLCGHGCPYCAAIKTHSKLQKMLISYLKKNNILFEQEKTFKWLKRISNLRLDFFLPDYNVAIEVQGEQHFNHSRLFDDVYNDTLSSRTERDKLKKQLCKEHRIEIFYIAEKQFVKDYELGHLYTSIEDMINDIIKEGTLD